MSARKKSFIQKPMLEGKNLRIQKLKNNHSIYRNSSISQMFFLLKAIGNQAAQRLFGPNAIQPKLTSGKPNVKYEQEAAIAADRMMKMPAHRVQKSQCSPVNAFYKDQKTAQAKSLCDKTPAVTTGLQNRTQPIKGGGHPMREPLRNYFEPRFDADFCGACVHTDAKAVGMARSINVKAFIKGKDMVFGAGQYTPVTYKGRRMLGHEHVVQQERYSNIFIQKRRGYPLGLSQQRTKQMRSIPFGKSNEILRTPQTLKDLAIKHYGTLKLWRLVYRSNTGIFKRLNIFPIQPDTEVPAYEWLVFMPISYFKNMPLPAPPFSPYSPKTRFITKKSDEFLLTPQTLKELAIRHYGRAIYWRYVYLSNKGVFKRLKLAINTIHPDTIIPEYEWLFFFPISLFSPIKRVRRSSRRRKGKAKRWGQDTIGTLYAFDVGNGCYNIWPYHLEQHAINDLNIAGAASCPSYYRKRIAQVSYRSKKTGVICADTLRPSAKHIIELSPAAWDTLALPNWPTRVHVLFTNSIDSSLKYIRRDRFGVRTKIVEKGRIVSRSLKGRYRRKFPPLYSCITKECVEDPSLKKRFPINWSADDVPWPRE